MAAAADWSSLHQDLLSRIFLLIACLADRVRASAACKHWRRVALDDPPTLPWLLTPSTAGISCYRIFGGLDHPRPSIPGEVHGARFCGSFPGGWFVAAQHDWRAHALLNLRSGERVPLPGRVRIPLYPIVLKCPIVIRVAAMSAPPSSGACVVAALASGPTTLAFWRPGMDCWSQPPMGIVVPHNAQDLTYHDGWFWAITPAENLVCYKPEINDGDAASLTIRHLVYKSHGHGHHQMTTTTPTAPGEAVSRYLLPSASGADLLMVKRFVAPARGGATLRFEVFSLHKEQDGRSASWRSYPMSGRLLFVGRSCSKSFDTGHAGSPGYIYFLDDVYPRGPLSVLQQKVYPCVDTGAWDCSRQEIKRCLPCSPPSDSSPCIWYLH
ncbi:uncharacterized protein LOC125514127 [Triticum urartu]|nr:uncharacterized protein LOC125514127 [Triticum urartu]